MWSVPSWESEAGCFQCHAELWTMYMSSMISWFNGGSGGMAGERYTRSKTHILPEEEPSQMLIEFLIPQLFSSYTHINFLSLMYERN